MEASGGVQDDDVAAGGFCLGNGGATDGDGGAADDLAVRGDF